MDYYVWTTHKKPTIFFRYKDPKIKNGFEYHIAQHRLQK